MKKVIKILLIIIIAIYAFVSLFPFVWSFISSLKPTENINDFTIPWAKLSLQNYFYILKNFPFARWCFNSIVIAVVVTIGNLLFNSMAGYSLAKIDFPGKKQVYFAILGMMMIPGQVVMVPIFIILSRLGWINTYQGMIVPFLFNFFNIFMMRQFFISIPVELEEAAQIDGLTRLGTFFKIILPISTSALTTQFILVFMGNWNSFLWPSLLARREDMYTLPVGLNSFFGQYFQFWDQILAGIMLLSIPAIVIFIIFQKRFMQGVATSGSKE